MNWKPQTATLGSRLRASCREKAKAAFTLVELLAVVAIMVLMMAFLGPAVSSIKGGRDIISHAYGISGAIEQARSYAMANNTYTWVGFYEEDGSEPWRSNGTTAGIGRVIVSTVASRNGGRYIEVPSDPFGTATAATSGTNVPIQQVGNLLKLEGVHMEAINTTGDTGNTPERPGVPNKYQVGHADFATTATSFKYPLVGTAVYTFRKIIEFNPRGEATRILDAYTTPPPSWLEVALQPARGNVIEKKYEDNPNLAAAAVLINGLSGQVKVIK